MAIQLDRLKAGIFALVRTATARLAYASPRFATVVSAASDGSSLDVVPEDPTFPSMAGIPVFSGQAGDRAVLADPREATVVVEFSEGDPSRPFVRSWAAGGTERVRLRTIAADELVINDGTAGAARVGDLVSLTLSPADISAIAAEMVRAGLVSPGGGGGGTPAPVEVTGTNVVATGSATVKIG